MIKASSPEESDNSDGRFVSNNKEAFKIGNSTPAARSGNDGRQRESGGECRRLGARENFSIIAATVIKPNKREITASTRGTRPHYPKSWKSSQAAAAADLMAFGKATAGGSKVVHQALSSIVAFGHSLSSRVFSFLFKTLRFTLFTRLLFRLTCVTLITREYTFRLL